MSKIKTYSLDKTDLEYKGMRCATCQAPIIDLGQGYVHKYGTCNAVFMKKIEQLTLTVISKGDRYFHKGDVVKFDWVNNKWWGWCPKENQDVFYEYLELPLYFDIKDKI